MAVIFGSSPLNLTDLRAAAPLRSPDPPPHFLVLPYFTITGNGWKIIVCFTFVFYMHFTDGTGVALLTFSLITFSLGLHNIQRNHVRKIQYPSHNIAFYYNQVTGVAGGMA